MAKPQRIRDPVHGLIVFNDEPLDQLAWNLLNTPEFQRLRRIKQLGLSDFVFPGATHTRFAHCIGVFQTARTLVGMIESKSGRRDEQRAAVAVLAALLHDLGHGPLSHAFEQAQRDRKRSRRHEVWTAQIILDENAEIKPLLEEYRPGISQEIADLLVSETPSDIYDSIVSSSFDADRLDYLRRDRLMTGTGAGAIDFDWLMENLRIETIDFDPVSDQTGPGTPRLSLCLDQKALEAAETFLLARFHLYTQVYLHKATRAIGRMLGALLGQVAAAVEQERFGEIGLDRNHPLAKFYASSEAETKAYLALDDAVIWSAVQQLCSSKDAYVRDLADRIRNRSCSRYSTSRTCSRSLRSSNAVRSDASARPMQTSSTGLSFRTL